MSRYFTYFPKTTYLDRSITDLTRRVKLNDNILLDPYAFLPYTIRGEDRAEDVALYYYGDQNKVWLVYLANNIIDPYTQWPMNNKNFDKTINKKYYQAPLSFTTIDGTSNKITIINHKFTTTDPVDYNLVSGQNPRLTSGSMYYAIKINDHNIRLATTAANANSGIAMNLSDANGLYTIQRNVEVWLQSTMINTNIVFYRNTQDPELVINPKSYALDTSLVTSEWNPIRVYDYEVELNDNRRTIYLVNKIYAKQVEEDLKKMLNE